LIRGGRGGSPGPLWLRPFRHRFNIYAGSCVVLAHDAVMAPQTRYTLRRNTASIMKGLGFWTRDSTAFSV